MLALAMVTEAVAVETFLPRQAVTMSGRVLAPSCKAAFDKETLNFTLGADGDGKMPAPQTLLLELSDCELTGLGVKLDAQTWQGYPERGLLKGGQSGQGSTHIYYTIGMGGDEREVGALLTLSADSPEWVKSSNGGYFHLNQEKYWLEVNGSPDNRGGMTIPFTVSLHQTEGAEKKGGVDDDAFNASFTLSLSYR